MVVTGILVSENGGICGSLIESWSDGDTFMKAWSNIFIGSVLFIRIVVEKFDANDYIICRSDDEVTFLFGFANNDFFLEN